MKNILLLAVLFISHVAVSQCGYYYFQNNKKITLGVFNRKGSQDGKVVYQISNVSKGATTTASITSEFFDKKGKSNGQSKGTMQCKGGILLFDMQMMMSSQQNSQFQNAEMQAKAVYLEYPSNVKVGDILKDGSFDMDVKMETGMAANFKMNITDRRVVGKESVTTPAGTWEAYKISYHMKSVISMGFAIPINSDMTEWFVPNFGMVKSESKFGKTELLSIE